jgi:CBS domain-containing protein
MKVEDLMTRDVIIVSPETSIQKAAKLMVDHRVSGLPVVDGEGRLVGIISEGDLILRQRGREKAPWWRGFFDDGERLAREYQKGAGITVGEVMTRSVLSVDPASGVEVAATILDARAIRRLPVMRDGQLVGILSRRDLVKALAAVTPATLSRPDALLRTEMRARMEREQWAPVGLVVDATDGMIGLWGLVRTETEKSALETMARAIEGCRGVQNHLVVRAEMPYHYGA